MASNPDALQRRPIPSRSSGWARRIARLLSQAGIRPNGISLAGLCFGLAAGGALAATGVWVGLHQRLLFVAAAVGILLRLLCNLFDGMVAVEHGKATPTGELYNEVPDRLADVAILIGAGYADGGHVATGYVAAIVALLTVYVRALGGAVGVSQPFVGPMAKQQRMFLVIGASLWGAAAPDIWQRYHFRDGLYGWGVMADALALIVLLGLLTTARRLLMVARDLRAGG